MMKPYPSRREFLDVGLSLPVAAVASRLGFGKPTSLAPSGTDAPKLPHSPLGKTGLEVMRLGLGAGASDVSVVERALDMGINYFDTARLYGAHESLLGAGLGKRRKDVIVSSKSLARTKDALLSELEMSLRLLNTDYLDIWFLHSKSTVAEVPDDLLEAQRIAKQQGKIRFAGVSTHQPKTLIPFLIQKGSTDVVLLTYNFTMKTTVDAAIEQAGRAGLGVIAMKSLAGAFHELPPEVTYLQPGNPRIPKLKTPGAMLAMLKWALKNPNVNTTIVGTTDMDQLEANAKALTEPYTEADEKLLAERLEQIAPYYCRMCGDCEGACAKGLPVADILRYLTYADGYGDLARGREHFRALPAAITLVRCTDCAACTVACPNGVRVPARLARAQELFG
jgi:hypothetical protein